MRLTPRWATCAFGLLLGIAMLVGLDRSGVFSSKPPHPMSDWSVVLVLICGTLLGMAAVTYMRGPRGIAGRSSPSFGGPESAGALRAILGVSPQAILAIDAVGNVTMWNPAAATLLGWSPEEVLTRPLPLVIDDDPLGARSLAQALRENRPWSGAVVRSRRKDGAALVMRVWVAPVAGGSRSPGTYVVTLEDAAPALAGDRSRSANAILAVGLRATDLPGLLEGVLDHVIGSLGVGVGGAWLGEVGVARGLAADLGLAIVRAPHPGHQDRERPAPFAVTDWRAAPQDAPARMREQFLLRGLRATVLTSFTSKGGHTGGLVVASPEPKAWTPEECALVATAAEALAEAADRLHLLDETRERLQLLDRARAAGQRLHHPASVADVARVVGEGALTLGGADRVAVYLHQPDGALTCFWSQGLSPTYVDRVLHHAKLLAGGHMMDGAKPDLLEISGRGIDGSAPILYPDVQALAPAVLVPRLTQAEGYRALGCWPLVYEDTVLGLLSCYYDAPRTWSAPEQDVLQTFAQEASFALRNARALDAQTQRAADLEVLFDLSRRLRAARNLEEIYPILVGHAMELVQADSGTLALLAKERPEFDCVFAVGMAPEMREVSFPVSGSPFGRVAQTGAMYQTANFGGEPLPVWMTGFRGFGPAVIVPVRSEQETIGVFWLGRKRRPDASPFAEAEARLLEGIAEIGGTAIRRARLFQNLEKSYMQMVVSLARTMDVRDSYTSGHSERISAWAETVAHELGCGEEEIQDVRWGALLHDIGKIGVPDAILRKPGKLTDAEWAIMRKHPEIGEEILASTERMRGVAALVRHHQERWNGTGYPDGLKGEEIPLGARILAVCDAYSAITDDRPYKKARTHEEAVAELHRCAGTQFDPRVVPAFCTVVEHKREREQAGRVR
ncbi:MAG TPA: HD domain-containing phosphohydrolase [bacterium]|nr:HD domain-containing phosphohydrolase [bacterium]